MIPSEKIIQLTEVSNVLETAKKNLSPNYLNYWKKRIFQQRYRYKGELRVVPTWSIKLQFESRREVFPLGKTDKDEAATEARAVYQFLRANGWQATIDRFKGKGRGSVNLEGTIGAFLQAQEGRSTLKPATLRIYCEKLRQIAAGVGGIRCSNERFDYVNGGAKRWRERVEALPMASLTPVAIEHWRSAYLKAKGLDPVSRKSAERSVASVIRQARSLFANQKENPFQSIKLKAEHPERYRSTINPAALLQLAKTTFPEGSRPTDGQPYLALCLCILAGLRKKEADLLEWSNVDLVNSVIKIRRTAYFSPKTDEAERDIDIPASFVAYLTTKAKKRGFVLEGDKPKPSALYAFYRAHRTWTTLSAWIKAQGVTGKKPIHSLRKESGSLIASQYGIEAARMHLGHRDIQTTSAHYVSKLSRREIVLAAPVSARD